MDWNKKIYISIFISGFKKHIKNKFTRINRPVIFNKAINFIIKIDNRYHKRLMEKRNNKAWRKGSY